MRSERCWLPVRASCAPALPTWSPDVSANGMPKPIVTNQGIAAVESALERHDRNVVCARIDTPQDDSMRLAAGRLALQT